MFLFKAIILLISCVYIITYPCLAQNQQEADSLQRIYEEGKLTGVAELNLLNDIADVLPAKKALKYVDELIQKAKKANNERFFRNGCYLKGFLQRTLGNPAEAMKWYVESIDLSIKLKDAHGEASAYIGLGDCYAQMKDHRNAEINYDKGIDILRHLGNTENLAAAFNNIGDAFLKIKKYDLAYTYCFKAKELFSNTQSANDRAIILGNIGMAYYGLGKIDSAKQNLEEGMHLLDSLKLYEPKCAYLINMSQIAQRRKDIAAAHQFAQQSLALAEQNGFQEQVRDANLNLSELYEASGDYKAAIRHLKAYEIYKDRVANLDSTQKANDIQREFDLKQEMGKRIAVKQWAIVLGVMVLLAILFLTSLYRSHIRVSKERKRSDNLLLNILPAETAAELKQKGKVEAVKFEQVTVLFTDFVDFSRFAEHVEPELVVKSIDAYYRTFDEIIIKHGLEKIKTIGDAYMCACGLPAGNTATVQDVINAALEMMAVVKSRLDNKEDIGHFDIRMGVHTGPAVAGIVGIKKWQYDIWGDTVNIASRMQSMSKPGRINISETTWQLIKNDCACEYRGEVEVKNRGLLKMYFLI